MIYPRTKVQERRLEVTTLLVRGVSPAEIAQALEVSRHTIYNDIRYIRSGRNEALALHTRNEIVSQLYLNAQARARFLWQTAENTDRDYVKVTAMRELRLNDERIVNKLPEPKRHTHEEEVKIDLEAMAARYKELEKRVIALRQRREQWESWYKEELARKKYDGPQPKIFEGPGRIDLDSEELPD